MSAGGIPSWALLEPFVFRRDDDESFPDESKAPIRVTSTTTWGATFRIAFSFGEPDHIARLYAHLPAPAFLDRKVCIPLRFVATHRHLALIRVATKIPRFVEDYFIFDAKHPSSLKALSPCSEPEFDYTRVNLPRRRPLPAGAFPHTLNVSRLGLWCGDREFVVAELTLFVPDLRLRVDKAFADIYLLRCSHGEDQLPLRHRGWTSMRVEFLSTDNDPADPYLQQICWWHNEAVVPFDKWLCWIDYHRGILFCDMSKLPRPTVSVVWFPLDKLPDSSTRCWASTSFFRAVSVVDHGRVLKFVNVTRHDGITFAPLQPGTGFTITCHSLVFGGNGSMAWEEDYTVTSAELWEANTPERLPRHILMFPQVDINRPHVAHFLSIEFGRVNYKFAYVNQKMRVVSIDMTNKTVESSSLYIEGDEGLQTGDDEFIRRKSRETLPFIPCEFPKFLNSSRKRKLKK